MLITSEKQNLVKIKSDFLPSNFLKLFDLGGESKIKGCFPALFSRFSCWAVAASVQFACQQAMFYTKILSSAMLYTK